MLFYTLLFKQMRNYFNFFSSNSKHRHLMTFKAYLPATGRCADDELHTRWAERTNVRCRVIPVRVCAPLHADRLAAWHNTITRRWSVRRHWKSGAHTTTTLGNAALLCRRYGNRLRDRQIARSRWTRRCLATVLLRVSFVESETETNNVYKRWKSMCNKECES